MSESGPSRHLLQLHKCGRYRSAADIDRIYEYAP